MKRKRAAKTSRKMKRMTAKNLSGKTGQKIVLPGLKHSKTAASENNQLATPFFLPVLIAGILAGGALSLLFPLEATDAPLTGNVIRIEANNERIAVVEEERIPFGAVHWHALVRIIAAGSEITIPPNIGIEQGNVDNEVSGVQAAPIHTHDWSGRLHIENNAPRLHEDRMTLGYFFNRVWQKRFSRQCILEYCNGAGGQVKMLVNGLPSNEFEDYVLHDGDEIVISFELP